MKETLTLQFDGGSRGNPGPAAAGVVILAADQTPIVTLGKFIGRATNNVAEYTGLIVAMEEAKKLGATRVIIRGDSELVIKQMLGIYRVKHPDMKVLYEKAQKLFRSFESAKIEHNLREKNELADKLANLAMDRKGDVIDEDGTPASANIASPRPTGIAVPKVGTSTSSYPKPAGMVQEERTKAGSIDELDKPSPQSPKAGTIFHCVRCSCEIELKQPSSIRPHQLRPFVCQCGTKMIE